MKTNGKHVDYPTVLPSEEGGVYRAFLLDPNEMALYCDLRGQAVADMKPGVDMYAELLQAKQAGKTYQSAWLSAYQTRGNTHYIVVGHHDDAFVSDKNFTLAAFGSVGIYPDCAEGQIPRFEGLHVMHAHRGRNIESLYLQTGLKWLAQQPKFSQAKILFPADSSVAIEAAKALGFSTAGSPLSPAFRSLTSLSLDLQAYRKSLQPDPALATSAPGL